MNWIILLLTGLTLGWALEFILDVLYWGRRNRTLKANLMQCNEKLASSQNVAANLKAQVASLDDQVASLNAQVASLKAERDQISNSLEEVDQWVETSMRQHYLDADEPGNTRNSSKEQATSVTRNTLYFAKSHLGHRADQLKGMVSTAREKLGRPQPTRWWNKGYCSVLAWIGSFRKNGQMPQACSINVK